jgi:hypothetical protein
MKLIILFLLVFVATTNAQYTMPKLRLPPLSEVEMNTWPSDTIAEAVVLLDEGASRFFISTNDGLEVQYMRHTKIKILKNAGISYGNVEIPIYHNKQETERVEFIQGNVYNIENGSIRTTPFNTKQVYDEKINNNWSVKKLALPNVKAGSLIEYSYSIITPFKFKMPEWQFQWDIPVVKSQYTLGAVPFYEYMFLFQGALKFSKQTKGEGTTTHHLGPVAYNELFYNFEMENVAAFRDEEFITSKQDNIIKMEFQLTKFTDIYGKSQNVISSWKELSRELMKNSDFGKYISSSERYFKNNLPFAVQNDTLENVKQAIDHVKNQYSWSGQYRLLPAMKANDFVAQKKGDSSEKNLFAIGLLNAMGINAKPVLISTRNHGRIKSDYPFVDAFNHVLINVKIGTNDYMLDTTDPYCPFGLLPLQCINNKGYIVDDKKSDNWATLINANPSMVIYEITQIPNPDIDSISTSIYVKANYYDAMKLRKQCISDLDALKEKICQNMQLESFSIEDLENTDKQLGIKAQGNTEIERAGNNLIIHPFSGLCETNNIFKSEKREYAVDLTYAYRRDYVTTITIPHGYEVKSLPGNCAINTPQMQISRTDSQNENKLTITASYIFTKAVYPPEEYAQLKSAFAQMVNRLNATVILAPIVNGNETAASK